MTTNIIALFYIFPMSVGDEQTDTPGNVVRKGSSECIC